MTNLLRRGRLEVETDLLLGAEEVLLPAGVVLRAGAPADAVPAARSSPAVTGHASSPAPAGSASSVSPAAAPAARGGFDAALFAPQRSPAAGAEPPHAAKAPSVRAAPSAPAPSRAGGDAGSGGSASAAARVGAEGVPAIAAPAVPIVDRVVPPGGASKAERLAALDAIHGGQCPHCTTATAHTRLVFGEGNPDAELVFVGEAPGETEDQLGRPFVGRAGEKLDGMIAAMGFERADVYIANVLKSRPPDNRTPLAHEIDRCGPYLLAQLAIIRPKVIVTLGGPASKLGITRLRGAFATVRLGVAEGAPFEVPVMPTFHPAYLLRNYTVETRAQVWEDLKKVLAALGRDAPARKAN